MDQSTETVVATKTIPVTIITGFLGAGKTSLLNEIISQNPETKFAIIENNHVSGRNLLSCLFLLLKHILDLLTIHHAHYGIY